MVRVGGVEWEKARRVPAELRAEMTRAARSPSTRGWRRAPRSDFAAFLPHLGERRAEAPLRELLRGVEGSSTIRSAARRLRARHGDDRGGGAVLGELREGIKPAGRGDRRQRPQRRRTRCLHGSFPGPRRRGSRRARRGAALAGGCVAAGYHSPSVRGRDRAADVRLTTRYDEGYLGTALWSVLHEAGHGMYENGVPRAFGARRWRAPVARLPRVPEPAVGELGRSGPRPSWSGWCHGCGSVPGPARRDRRRGPVPGRERVEPSLIRVEADEVTYNLHIVAALRARGRDLRGADRAGRAAGGLERAHEPTTSG